MKPTTLRSGIFILMAMLITLSCRKVAEYPIEPLIEFKSIAKVQNSNGFDVSISVVLSFTDGDGDVGYKPRGENDPIFDDPNSQYYNNFIVDTWRKVQGVWTRDTINISARLPYLTPDASNRALKGEIKRDLPVPPALRNDTFRYDIFIYDRALHKSNTITTPEVILYTQ